MQMREKLTPLQELQSELSDLRVRATKVGYKNKLPQMPKATRFGSNNLPPDHLMQGFRKRLSNWTSGLLQLEYPGGIPVEKPIEKVEASSLEQLVTKFEN